MLSPGLGHCGHGRPGTDVAMCLRPMARVYVVCPQDPSHEARRGRSGSQKLRSGVYSSYLLLVAWTLLGGGHR